MWLSDEIKKKINKSLLTNTIILKIGEGELNKTYYCYYCNGDDIRLILIPYINREEFLSGNYKH